MRTIAYRVDKEQYPAIQPGYIQYPVINHNGKEYEKEYIHNMYN